MIPMAGKILKVGRWALGKYGRKETAKQAVGNGATAVVSGFLIKAAGMEVETAAALGVALVTLGNAIWEWARTYTVAVEE